MTSLENLISDRSRSEDDPKSLASRWLKLLLDVALITNEESSLDEAIISVIRRTCEHNGWYAGNCRTRESGLDLWWCEPGEDGRRLIADDEIRELTRLWSDRTVVTGHIQHVDDFSRGRPTDLELPPRAPTSGGALSTPLLVGDKVMGAMTFFSRHPLSRNLDSNQFDGLLRVIEGIGAQMGRIVERWHLLRRIAEEAESERASLGQEIHDGLAQQLVGVKLLAQNLRKQLAAGSEQHTDKWNLLIENLVQAQDQARALARGLSAISILESSDSLIERLEDLCEVVRTGHGLDCDLEVRGSVTLQDELTRAQLLRIAREAVFNALRHAEPSRISIELSTIEGERILEIRDDGSGLPENWKVSSGMGMASMRHRAQLVGAHLELESEPGRGTVVRCVLPKR